MSRDSNVYFFNPTCDFAIANSSPFWSPNKLLVKMENDLSTLPVVFASKNDIIISANHPSKEYIDDLKQAGFKLPNFILKRKQFQPSDFSEYKLNQILPWGWSPAAHHFFEPIKNTCSELFKNSPVYNWNPKFKEFASRRFSQQILKNFINHSSAGFLLPEKFLPEICYSKPEVEKQIIKWGKIMIKAPWSSSGRGLQPITKTPVHEKVWERISGIMSEQGFVMAEPFLNKVADFALLFEIKNKSIERLGSSYFFTDKKGQYQGNIINPAKLTENYEVNNFLSRNKSEISEMLALILSGSGIINYYEGVFGVDILVYRDENGELKINPCLEINFRHTMGHVALALKGRISENKTGRFQIFFNPRKTYFEYANDLKLKHPLKMKNNKIEAGFLSLTDISETTRFGAFLLVS